jgi:hydrogenase maturation protease
MEAGSTSRRTLVIGIGNVLRTDDGVGFAAVERLEHDARLADATLLWVQQLTPELAVDFAAADIVVLIDADAELAPGEVSRRHVEPEAADGPGMTHHVDPASLAALAADLYAGSPDVFVVGVGSASLDVGEGLSPAVAAALPRVVETVVALLGASRAR